MVLCSHLFKNFPLLATNWYYWVRWICIHMYAYECQCWVSSVQRILPVSDMNMSSNFMFVSDFISNKSCLRKVSHETNMYFVIGLLFVFWLNWKPVKIHLFPWYRMHLLILSFMWVLFFSLQVNIVEAWT